MIGYCAQQHQNMEAANQLYESDIMDVEVINLRRLNPLDINTLILSVQKTGRCVVSHEAPKRQGFCAEISAQITEKCLLNLKCPVFRYCGLDIPFPNG